MARLSHLAPDQRKMDRFRRLVLDLHMRDRRVLANEDSGDAVSPTLACAGRGLHDRGLTAGPGVDHVAEVEGARFGRIAEMDDLDRFIERDARFEGEHEAICE